MDPITVTTFSPFFYRPSELEKTTAYKEHPNWDHDHAVISESFPGPLTDVNKIYNKRFQGVEPPRYERVLIVGGGPSFDSIPEGQYDAVFLTLPVVKAVIDEFTGMHIVIVDAEVEGWVPWIWYPDYISRPDVFKYWPKEKFVHTNWNPNGIIWAEDVHPRSSGALALDLAVRCGAEAVYITGIDLNGHYEKFKAETDDARAKLKGVVVFV